MTRAVLCGMVLWVGCSTALGAKKPAKTPQVEATVRLSVSGGGDLKASDVQYAVFPSGKRCAFTYFGARSPKTIGALTKLGFRTTVYVSPGQSAESLRALETAGADIGINVWGAKGTYASHIGANTIQEAFDAVASSRIVLRKKCSGPLACGAVGGHYSPQRFPIDRDPDRGSGFAYAYHDSNYLLLSDNKVYMVYLGRLRDKLLAHRDNYDNRMRSHRVPNEVIYYQILANQFGGTLRRSKKGQIVRFSIRDFKAPDLEDLGDAIGRYGKHKDIWHGSEADFAANEYVRKKVHVKSVKPAGDGVVEVALGVEQDVFLPYLLTPLPLQLPKACKVTKATVNGTECTVTAGDEATYVDVPLRKALTGACRMSVKLSLPDMTVPDRMPLTLTIANPTDKPITAARLKWVGEVAMTVTGGDGAAFDVPAKGKKDIKAEIRTAAGARFGMTPFRAVVAATHGGAKRLFMQGFEVIVAPRLRVEMDPMQRIPLPKGREQHLFVHIDNKVSKSLGGPPNTLISHKAGPCKGTVGWDLPDGMKAIPEALPFELAANSSQTLIFKVRNDVWSEDLAFAKPVIKFAGETQPVHVLFPGTRIVRSKKWLDFQPLDAKGLLVYASWDDKSKSANYDRACGPVRAGQSGSPCIYTNEGVKGWALSARTGALCDSYKNIDYQKGTICLWLRKDPQIRNENTYVPDPEKTAKVGASQWNNHGESIFGMNSFPQIAGSSQSGITLRRYRSWKGETGYLQATYQGMGRQLRYLQVPFEWTEKWRHVAVLWDIKAKRLEIYLDGQLTGKADPGKADWYGAPWDHGRPSGEIFSPISCDHGKWTGTQRDEFYVYNRPLTPKEIVENMNAAKAK